MTIRFKCPKCQKTLGVKDHLAGKVAKCPACKNAIRIPTPVPGPSNVDELAMSALADEPVQKEAETALTQIVFTCDFCDEEVSVAPELAGKQTQCPNPDCRRIIKVPIPKQEVPRDWREKIVRGPSAAKISQPEKLEGVMGSPEDRRKVSGTALREAGVIEETVVPLSIRDWIRRGLWAASGVVALVVVTFILMRMNTERKDRNLEKGLDLTNVEVKLASPVLMAEISRGKGLWLLRKDKRDDAHREFMAALSQIKNDPGKKAPVNEDLFLIDLALSEIEMGGSEAQVIDKVKFAWGNEVFKEVKRTLDRIQTPEAKLWAVRDIVTRLLAKKNDETDRLAVQLAANMANADPKSSLRGQHIALLMRDDKLKAELDRFGKVPNPNDDINDFNLRDGYAEGYARKGDYDQALKFATAKGPPRDKLEACIGAAAIALANDGGKDESASKFVQAALDAAKQQKDVQPWLLLHLVRVGTRTSLAPKVEEIIPSLPRPFKERAELEAFQARCAKATEPLSFDAVKGEEKDDTIRGLAVEAAARQHATLGRGETLSSSSEGDVARYRPLVLVGQALGDRDPRP